MPGYEAATDRLTLVLSGNASGDMKLKSLNHSEFKSVGGPLMDRDL